MKNNTRKLAKHIVNVMKRPEIARLPGQLAFYFLMSLIPIIALAALIASKIVADLDLMSLLDSFFPEVFANFLENMIISANSYNNFLILLFFYIFVGANGPKAIITCSNTLYGIKGKGFFETQLKAMFMTIIMVILILFVLFIPLGGNFLIATLSRHVAKARAIYEFQPLYYTLKYLISFFVIFISTKLLYTMAPNRKIKSKNTTIGALFTSVTWILLSDVFLFYITHVAKYQALYGNFANILVLLLWIYLLAYLFVIGMALNINWYHNNFYDVEVVKE